MASSSKLEQSHVFQADFKYSHKNPYHDRLQEFEDFVLRDDESEKQKGKWRELFDNKSKLHVEVGTGYGHFMHEFCEKNPDDAFVGLDYRFKRSYQLANRLKQLQTQGTNNFKYLRAKGERLSYMFGESEVDSLYYFFPDPWPKTRHHKKRLFQLPFLKSAHEILKPGATFFIKTDHDDYAVWMKNVIENQDLFNVKMSTLDLHTEYPDSFLANHITKFEKIFLAKNIKIKAFELEVKNK